MSLGRIRRGPVAQYQHGRPAQCMSDLACPSLASACATCVAHGLAQLGPARACVAATSPAHERRCGEGHGGSSLVHGQRHG
jgi:hypothetical protein